MKNEEIKNGDMYMTGEEDGEVDRIKSLEELMEILEEEVDEGIEVRNEQEGDSTIIS